MIDYSRCSVLYVPGDSDRMLRKCVETGADLLLLNLEDGVSAAKKDAARLAVTRALLETDFGKHEVAVRVNDPETETGRSDLAGIVPRKPDGICLPKIETGEEIRRADRTIGEIEARHAIPEGTIRLHAMIESAAGVLHAADIAAASPRMTSLIFGTADYIDSVRCRPGEGREELSLALQMMVLAARAAGIDAIDGPCFDIRDPEKLRRESMFARRLGFDGKSALHPGQIAVINDVFDVSPEEVEWAEQVVRELDEAERNGRALTVMDGRLIDNPHLAVARKILKKKSMLDRRPARAGDAESN